MAGVLASTAMAIGLLDKAVTITQKLANNSDELDKAALKLELSNLMVELANAKIEALIMQTLLFDAEQKIKDLEGSLKYKSISSSNMGCTGKMVMKLHFVRNAMEVKQIKTHMVLFPVGQIYSAYWFCKNCNLST